MKALAFTTKERAELLPGVPTVAEQGESSSSLMSRSMTSSCLVAMASRGFACAVPFASFRRAGVSFSSRSASTHRA